MVVTKSAVIGAVQLSCPEEIAYHAGYIDAGQLTACAKKYGKSGYGAYLMRLLTSPHQNP